MKTHHRAAYLIQNKRSSLCLLLVLLPSLCKFWLLFQAFLFSFFSPFVCYFYICFMIFSLSPLHLTGLRDHKNLWYLENNWKRAFPFKEPQCDADATQLSLWCGLCWRRYWLSDLWLVRQPSHHTQYWNSCSQTGRGRWRNGPEWSRRGCLASVI